MLRKRCYLAPFKAFPSLPTPLPLMPHPSPTQFFCELVKAYSDSLESTITGHDSSSGGANAPHQPPSALLACLLQLLTALLPVVRGCGPHDFHARMDPCSPGVSRASDGSLLPL